MMASGLSLPFLSSIRERDSPDYSSDHNLSTSPESSQSIVSLHEARIRDWEDQGRYSPQTVVAGRLGELAIRGDFHQLPDRSLHQPALFPLLQTNYFSNHSELHGFPDMAELAPSAALERPFPHSDGHVSTSSSAAEAESQLQAATSSMNTSRQPPSSPSKNKNIPIAKSRSPMLSPPPSSEMTEDLLTWNDSETTGHNPTDPEDDGYGINGIGFKPTAAIAWARSQKRQKQVAEWKHREAKEARERRRERRDNGSLDKLRTVQSGGIQKKVKFNV
ncbi:hypothetical protein BJY04DRAFT_193351 [Aspergillus karnatakaensis]|uniref:uncharacterized protein n=1 Tax=Aspergillus karnatakaensis TaxID=1810916 RepID=UPI003CCE2BC4